MDEFEDELDNIVTLADEEGNEVRFEFLDLVELDGKEYVVLLPADEYSEEVVILRYDGETEDGEEENYLGVEDDQILHRVFEIFKERFKDEFDFQD